VSRAVLIDTPCLRILWRFIMYRDRREPTCGIKSSRSHTPPHRYPTPWNKVAPLPRRYPSSRPIASPKEKCYHPEKRHFPARDGADRGVPSIASTSSSFANRILAFQRVRRAPKCGELDLAAGSRRDVGSRAASAGSVRQSRFLKALSTQNRRRGCTRGPGYPQPTAQ
jgi:hypothetical protein